MWFIIELKLLVVVEWYNVLRVWWMCMWFCEGWRLGLIFGWDVLLVDEYNLVCECDGSMIDFELVR